MPYPIGLPFLENRRPRVIKLLFFFFLLFTCLNERIVSCCWLVVVGGGTLPDRVLPRWAVSQLGDPVVWWSRPGAWCLRCRGQWLRDGAWWHRTGA